MTILGDNPTDITQMTMMLEMLTVTELKEILRLSGTFPLFSHIFILYIGLKTTTPKKKGKVEGTNKQQLLETILQHKSQRTLDGKLLIPKLLAKVVGKKAINSSF